jgi:hypothetical protein
MCTIPEVQEKLHQPLLASLTGVWIGSESQSDSLDDVE